MCTGTTHAFLCGHLLHTFSHRCPQQCALPSTQAVFIRDTCAACHPDQQIRESKRRFERQFAVYSFQLAQADVAEDHAKTWEIREKIKRLHVGYLEEVEEARRRGRGCGEVVWPGRREEGDEPPPPPEVKGV